MLIKRNQEARCMYCGCFIAIGIMEASMKDGLASEYCEDCLEKHWEEITGEADNA